MKLRSVFACMMMMMVLTSCVEKTKLCKMDHEEYNGDLVVQYTYNGDELIQLQYLDTAGNVSISCLYEHGGNGMVSTVNVYYGESDSLVFTSYVFSASGKIDSLQQWTDSNSDDIADEFGRTWIYTYSGDKIIEIGQRTASVNQPYATLTWSGNNLTEMRFPNSGEYYVWSYSGVKDPYYQYMFSERFTQDGAIPPPSEYLAYQQAHYDSMDVLINTIEYQPTNISDGVQIYNSTYSSTTVIKLACTEM